MKKINLNCLKFFLQEEASTDIIEVSIGGLASTYFNMFKNPSEEMEWSFQAARFFLSLGWDVDLSGDMYGGTCYTSPFAHKKFRGVNEVLYLHPHEFSGRVRESTFWWLLRKLQEWKGFDVDIKRVCITDRICRVDNWEDFVSKHELAYRAAALKFFKRGNSFHSFMKEMTLTTYSEVAARYPYGKSSHKEQSEAVLNLLRGMVKEGLLYESKGSRPWMDEVFFDLTIAGSKSHEGGVFCNEFPTRLRTAVRLHRVKEDAEFFNDVTDIVYLNDIAKTTDEKEVIAKMVSEGIIEVYTIPCGVKAIRRA